MDHRLQSWKRRWTRKIAFFIAHCSVPTVHFIFLVSCFFVLFVDRLPAADWASWRGPFQSGVSPDSNLPATWSDDPKKPVNFLWKAPYGCRSTPIVMDGHVYINNQVGQGINEQERVMCFDAVSGKVLWEKKFSVFHTDIVSVRLGWTHLAGDPDTGNVYWHGTQGDFVCFDKNGKVLWQRQLMELDGRVSGYGGRLPSPVVVGDLVVMPMINSSWGDQGKGGNRLLAMNKRDGTPVWWSQTSEKPGTYFSTPVVATINGEQLLVTGGSDGAVHAIQAGTGKHIWSYTFCQGAINCSPVVDGTLVYANHGEESPGSNVEGRIVCLDAAQVVKGQPKLVWEVEGVNAKYTSPLVQAGRVYIGDDVAKLWCFDGKTGKTIWSYRYGRNAMASPVWGDGKIYVSDKNAKFHILEPGETKCKPLDEHFFPAVAAGVVETYGNAAIAQGRIYFPTNYEIYCIGTNNAKSVNVTAPKSDGKKGKPAQMLIYPCDITSTAGSVIPLQLRTFDEFGNFLQDLSKPAEVKWQLPQPPLPAGAKNQPPALAADIDGGALPAKLTLKKTPTVQQGYVEAEWNGLKAKARVRVVPTLPYAENFDKIPVGGVPAAWVNCAGKFVVKELKDGNRVLAKVNANSNEVIARGSCFFGMPELTDYNIEADVMSSKLDKEEKGDIWLSDMGVGACRYTLVLMGQTQKLRLFAWDAMPRVDFWIPYKWSPDTWYRLKLTALVRDGKTTVRGKVWPRGQPEPSKWDIEFSDPTPNLE
jgi:outer membrane protein assembly factor BamB